MSDLDVQIRTYIDGTSEPLSVDDVLETTPHVSASTSKPPVGPVAVPRGLLIGLATALIVALVIGLPFLWSIGGDEQPVATTTVPTTAAPPTTAAAPAEETVPTSVVEVAPTTVSEMTVDVTQSVVPGLGTLVWERVSGDSDSLPENVAAFDDGVYVAYEDDKQWRSVDGITWTSAPAESETGGYRWFHSEGDYAIAGDDDGSILLELTDGVWTEIELDAAQLPAIEGVALRPNFWFPIESNGVRLIPVTLYGQIGLGEVYGTFEVDCGEPEPCEMEPWPEWDEPTQRLRVQEPERQAVLASLAVQVDGNTLSLVEDASGEAVITLRGGDVLSAEELADQIKRMGSVHLGGTWLSADGAPFVWQDQPWSGDSHVAALPDGGFAAFEFEYDWRSTPPLVSSNSWTSDDGIEWVAHGPPSFVDPTADHMMVTDSPDGLLATVITGHDPSTGFELYDAFTSRDGVSWEPTESVFPPHSDLVETNFGYVVTALPQGEWLIWVSTDGETWHEVVGPPGPHEPGGAGYAGADAVGDHIFVSVGEDAGSRTLWVGTFEQ